VSRSFLAAGHIKLEVFVHTSSKVLYSATMSNSSSRIYFWFFSNKLKQYREISCLVKA